MESCCHVDRGQRCANVGSLSESTRGGGPWYCHEHFPPFAGRGYGKPRTAPPGGFKALRDALGQPSDPEAAAEREAIRAESLTRAERETERL